MIRVRELVKEYRGRVVTPALRGVDLDVEAGAFAAVMGPSGCGKSTLLYVLGGMLGATSGSVEVGGFDVTAASEGARAAYRRTQIGFVFQRFNLLSALDVEDNLRLACRIAGRSEGAAARIDALLERFGLSGKRRARPLELSQGEQQRVAVARALVMHPAVLLADEPTGDLDEATADALHALLREMHQAYGLTSIIATHNPRLASACDRVLRLEGGRLLTA